MNKLELLQKELLQRLADWFGPDTRRIEHGKQVLRFAIEILREEQADPYVVIPAAILHDVGIKTAEEKYHSSAPEYQEQEGPRIAGEILVDMAYEHDNIVEICAIIAHHHHPQRQESDSFKVVYDADWLVNLREYAATEPPEKLRHMVETVFLTQTGGRLARALYLTPGS